MDMTYISGRSFGSSTTGYKEENGDWHLTVVMTETLIYPNGLERQEVIEGTARDINFDAAHKAAMRDVLQQLENIVYSRGFDSLIEGMDYERSMEALGDSDVNTASEPE